MNADTLLLLAIHNHLSSTVMNGLMVFVTSLTNGGFIWILLGAVLLCNKKTRIAGLSILVAIALDSILVNLIIKPIVMRERPYLALGLSILIKAPNGTSFPSGHSSVAFTAAAVYCMLARTKFERRFRWFILFWAFLTAFSRVYLLVHYPSDVIVGAILGVMIAPLAIVLTDSIVRALKKQKYPDRSGFFRKFTDCLPDIPVSGSQTDETSSAASQDTDSHETDKAASQDTDHGHINKH